MIEIRRSEQRARFDYGWLLTYRTFSFGDYYDARNMGFRSLRVINEDRIKPGQGFPMHFHSGMEIFTYVLEGALTHRDTLGNGSVIRAGDVQRMSAGTGVMHSEYNNSKTDLLHLLQIWILPADPALQPSYEQKVFPAEEKRNKLRLILSKDGREGSVTIHQDVNIYTSILSPAQKVEYSSKIYRYAWVQLISGSILLNTEQMNQGDGAAVTKEESLTFTARDESEFLLFDLA